MTERTYHRYVLQIWEQRNLTKAAAALGISQPALSSGLTNLESELGFKIFNRRKVPITLTPEGELYLSYLQRLQVLAEDFRHRISTLRQDADRHVSIGGPVAYIESMVADAVTELGKTHPEYRVTMKCSPLAELIEMAGKGEIHCFICTSGELADNFTRELIQYERVYLCIPRENPLNERLREHQVLPGQDGGDKLFDYSILSGETFLFMEEGQPLARQMEQFFREYGITPNCQIRVNQVSTAVNLAIRGKGICFASEDALLGNHNLEDICIYPLPDTISGREIYVAYDKELFLSAACKDLIHCLNNRRKPYETH